MAGKGIELPERPENSVKGDFGRVLVVGGNHRYTNAPAIVALGALRAGTDLVTVAAPERSASVVPSFALNIISESLEGERLERGHVEKVLELGGEADCLAIGPGLGREEEAEEAVVELLDSYDGEAVVDADAIRAAAGEPGVLEGTVVTPHAGEFEALTGEEPGGSVEDRKSSVERFAEDFGCTVLLKGPVDVVSEGERTEASDTGNPYMTRGGTGDVLTGIVSGLVAQGMEPFQAAVEAARVNGEAGDLALEEYGEGFLLEEMLEKVSGALGGGG